jgi:hypothetical protein
VRNKSLKGAFIDHRDNAAFDSLSHQVARRTLPGCVAEAFAPLPTAGLQLDIRERFSE